MKKLVPLILTTTLVSTTVFANDHVKSVYQQSSYKGEQYYHQPSPIITRMGVALEDRTSYADGYLFMDQLIRNGIYWELRAYYLYNYIVTSPPTKATPAPSIKDEQNLRGTGAVALLGYNIPINTRFELLPFVRFRYLTNNASPYKDSFDNKITSMTYTYYAGMRLSMRANEYLTLYAQYYGGYGRYDLHGSGYFKTNGRPVINVLTATFEIAAQYQINDRWRFTPYLQLDITDNNPNSVALKPPISNSGLTTNNTIFAARLSYTF